MPALLRRPRPPLQLRLRATIIRIILFVRYNIVYTMPPLTTATVLPGSGRNSAICRRPTAPPPPQTRDWDHRAGPTRRRRCRAVSRNLLPFQSDCRAERSSPHSAARLRPLFARFAVLYRSVCACVKPNVCVVLVRVKCNIVENVINMI